MTDLRRPTPAPSTLLAPRSPQGEGGKPRKMKAK